MFGGWTRIFGGYAADVRGVDADIRRVGIQGRAPAKGKPGRIRPLIKVSKYGPVEFDRSKIGVFAVENIPVFCN